jgi:dATP pyrophosphohydrolase
MARTAFQVLVFPFRKNKNNQIEFSLLQRSDAGFWKGVAGGGEDDETPLVAAKRETFEETGILLSADFLQLDTIESVPVTAFKDSPLWGENVYVIPQFCFGVEGSDWEIELSQEHSSFGWFLYEQAQQLLKYDGDKTALWELNQRLKGRGPIGGE